VFNKPMYKPLAPLSAILSLALMLGGLLCWCSIWGAPTA